MNALENKTLEHKTLSVPIKKELENGRTVAK